jgi:hypothetical protein
MTPADLFGVDVKTLGRKREIHLELYDAFWEYKNGQRLVCASVKQLPGTAWEGLVSLHFADSEETDWLPDQAVSFLKSLLRTDVAWERVAGQTFRALFPAEVVDGSQRDT